MSANSGEETQVNAQGSHVGSCLAIHPKNTQVSIFIVLQECTVVDGSNSKLSLDGRNERRSLEECPRECFHRSLNLGNITSSVKTRQDDISLSGSLLRLDQTSGAIDAYNQAARNFRIECSGVSRLFDPKNLFDPGDHLVGTRIGRLI